MNELKLTNLNGIETVDSRQVAEAIGEEQGGENNAETETY